MVSIDTHDIRPLDALNAQFALDVLTATIVAVERRTAVRSRNRSSTVQS